MMAGRALRKRGRHLSGVSIAPRYAYLSDADPAFTWLERAFQERDPQLVFVFNMDPSFDPVRDDVRFVALAERVGVALVAPDGPLATPPED